MGSPSPFEDSASHNNILEPFDFDFQGIFDSQNISRSTSDIGDMRNTKIVSKISEEVMESPLEDSISDIIFEPFDEQPSSGRWSKIVLSTSFAFPSSTSDLNLDLSSQNDAVYGPSLTTFEANDKYNTSHDQAMLAFEKSYSMEKRKQNLSNIPLPQSAATFYNGISPEMEIVESCESIYRLNNYLRGRKDDVKAGVPGKFLHAVIGQDISGKPSCQLLYPLVMASYDA